MSLIPRLLLNSAVVSLAKVHRCCPSRDKFEVVLQHQLAHDVRKHLVSLRKSKCFVAWSAWKPLIDVLNTQLTMIAEKIAPEGPTTAFELF